MATVPAVGASSLETFVCSSATTSGPLECNDHQWIRVVAETYAPETDLNGSTCGQNISSCNTYFRDVGMLANCNGPAWRDGAACTEEVDVASARRVSHCLQNMENISTLVQYDCIDGSTVIDLCEANATFTSRTPLYLASLGYPATVSEGKMCTCTIKGSNLKMNAVDIRVRSQLPWADELSTNDIYKSVLSVTSGSNILWRSKDCAACTTMNLMNTNLFLPFDDTSYQDVTVIYSDFGLPAQNVWVEIFEFGPRLDISCNSSSLPPDKIITTTTSMSTTTTLATTAPATSTLIATSSTSSTLTTSTLVISTPETTTQTTAKPATLTPTATTQVPNTSTIINIIRNITTPHYETSKTSKSDDLLTTSTVEIITADVPSEKVNNPSGSPVVLTVTLTMLLLLMIVVVALLSVIIYRRRHVFKSDDYRSPWACLQFWCHRNICHKCSRQSPDDNYSSHNSFDVVAMQDQQNHLSIPTNTPDEYGNVESKIVNAVNSEKPFYEGRKSQQNSANLSINNDEPLISPDLYKSHQQMVDKEIVKMRHEISAKSNKITSPTVYSTSASSTNIGDVKDNFNLVDEAKNADRKRNQKGEDKNVDSNFLKNKEILLDNVSNKSPSGDGSTNAASTRLKPMKENASNKESSKC